MWDVPTTTTMLPLCLWFVFHSSCGSNTAHCAISAETKAGDDGDDPQNQKRAPHLEAKGSWHTLPETNFLAPENRPKPNRKVVFQPSFFRGELLNFRGVLGCPVGS